MQRHRAYRRERYADDEDYYADHPAEDRDAPEMKDGEVTVGDTGLTHDEFMQAVADLEAHGWQGCTVEPPETVAA